MKLILLAGGESTHCYPIARKTPFISILNRPLIMHQFEWLEDNGVTDVAVVMPQEDAAHIQRELGEAFPGLRIHYVSEPIARGPAGAIKACEKFIGGDSICVMNGNLYLRSLDLRRFLCHHVEANGIATLGTLDLDSPQNYGLENLLAGKDGAIRGIDCLHPSRDRRSPMRFAGIYAFRPEVSHYISEHGYVDIKEELLPTLSRAGLTISVYRLKGYNVEIGCLSEYYKLQHTLLRQGLFNGKRYLSLGDSIWCEEGAKVSPSAHLIGPVMLGRDCVIEHHACIIGPAILGNRARVLEGGLVRESILGDSVTVSKYSKVEYSIVGQEYVTEAYGLIKDCVMTCDQPATKLTTIDPVHLWSRRRRYLPAAISCKYRKCCKRVLDVTVTVLVFTMFLPLMLVFATAIKLESPGPIFFRQRRCGLDGREFVMVKFRTMCVDAAALQQHLWAQKTVDGPMFKMKQDPRVTWVGQFLRASSLDELPQLYNVLKGEMSLVGPRPLTMEEMKCSPSWRDVRLNVKPGVTGLWQVNGRSDAAFHDWIRYDLHYVRNFSLWFDLKILLKTILIVVRRIGAR